MIKPTINYVAVEKIQKEKTPGGIVLPVGDNRNNLQNFGKVISTNSEETTYSAGDVVIYMNTPHSRNIGVDGMNVVLVHKEEIVATTDLQTAESV